MDKLLEKYESGQCTKVESAKVEDWLKKQEWSNDHMQSCNQSVKDIRYGKSVMDVLQNEESYLDQLLTLFAESKTSEDESDWVESFLQHENEANPDLYDQYNDLMKTQLSKSLHSIDTDADETQWELIDMPSLYQDYVAHFKQEQYSKDISIEDQNAVTQIEIEEMPQIYNDYIAAMQSQEFNPTVESILTSKETQKKEAKVISLNTKIWRAVAAVGFLIIGFFAVQNFTSNNNSLASNTIEITDPDEALELTLAALGAAAHSLETGNNQLRKIKAVEKTDVFK